MSQTMYKQEAPVMKSTLSTAKIMFVLMTVLLGLIGISSFYQFTRVSSEAGIRSLLIPAIAVIVAVATELGWYGGFYKMKGEELKEKLSSSFPIITALILALTVPVWTPYYVIGAGSFVAILIGKLLFGGFGWNIFNPAVVGRAFIALSFGSQIGTDTELAVHFTEQAIAEGGNLTGGVIVEAGSTITSAIAQAFNWLPSADFLAELNWSELLLGFRQGAMGETFTGALILFAILLIVLKVIDWRIMGSILLTVFGLAFAHGLVEYSSATAALDLGLMHLVTGGLLFGAIIMATDPVTSPTAPAGKWIYGIFIGMLVYIIRVWAGLPEGVIYAIAFANILVPTIDNVFLKKRTHINFMKRFIPVGSVAVLAIGAMFGVRHLNNVPFEETEVIQGATTPAFEFVNDDADYNAVIGVDLTEDEVRYSANDNAAVAEFNFAATLASGADYGVIVNFVHGYHRGTAIVLFDSSDVITDIDIKGSIASSEDKYGNPEAEAYVRALKGETISAVNSNPNITGASDYTEDGVASMLTNLLAVYEDVKGGWA